METLTEACSQNNNLQVILLFDYLRGLRDSSNNSFSVLQPLLNRFGNRVKLNFYHTPHLTGLKKKILPNRINEIVGVQHTKLYIFDDNVLISG